MRLSKTEVSDIMDVVWKFQNIFKTLVENSFVTIREGRGTAYVTFNKEGGCTEFVVFKEFWDKLNQVEKAFVLAHEVLHIYLGHGKRWNVVPGYSHKERNHAADLAINEALYSIYHFNEADTPYLNSIGIVRMDFFVEKYKIEHLRAAIEENNTFEANLLKIPKDENKSEEPDENPEEGQLDDHSPFQEVSEFEQDAIMEEAKRIAEDAGMPVPEESDTLPRMGQTAGAGAGCFRTLDMEAVKKKKWESIVIKVTKKLYKECEKEEEDWLPHRRKDDFFKISGVLLPTDKDLDAKRVVKDKKEIFFFIDTSGSCSDYTERFMKAYLSIPTDVFEVRAFSFDGIVESIFSTGKGGYRVHGGGGTNFGAVDKMVNHIVDTEEIEYPSAIFVLTDGYGTPLSPRMPNRWHWMLTANGTKQYIPQESHSYELKNFE